MKKHTKVFIIFALLILGIILTKFYIEYQSKEQLKINIVKEEALSLSGFMTAFRQTYQNTFIHNEIPVDNKTINLLPVRTTKEIGDVFSKIINNQVTIKTVSNRPRNPINQANTQEMKIINYFNNNKKEKEYFENFDGEVFYYAKPLYIKELCLKCHGKKEDAVKTVRDNYDTAYDYKIGDLRGILSLKISKNKIVKQIDSNYERGVYIAIAVYILFLISIYTMINIIIKNEKEYADNLEENILLKTKELLYEKDYIETIVESNNNAIIAINWSGQITTYNKKAEEIFGWAKEEMMNTRNLINLIPEEYKDIHTKGIEQYFKTGKLTGALDNAHQVEAIHKNGTIFPIRISLGSKFKSLETIVIANISDITDEVMHKEALLRSDKLASMGEMIGNIAHQWRQPLSVISTAATGIIMQKEYGVLEEDKIVETCSMINDNAQYLSKTIDDFKNFIKGDRTKKLFNLKDNIDSFSNLVASSIKSHNINLIVNLQEDIQIDGYENELTQCLINIFNNAKDILIEKNIKNKLVFISTSIKNDKVIIKIKDNGGGIPEDILPKIFDPYFTTKHQSQGTGLGLHMTYNLVVEGMDGLVEATNIKYTYENEEYTGVEFTISLPN